MQVIEVTGDTGNSGSTPLTQKSRKLVLWQASLHRKLIHGEEYFIWPSHKHTEGLVLCGFVNDFTADNSVADDRILDFLGRHRKQVTVEHN
jgi:hypothetical protein